MTSKPTPYDHLCDAASSFIEESSSTPNLVAVSSSFIIDQNKSGFDSAVQLAQNNASLGAEIGGSVAGSMIGATIGSVVPVLGTLLGGMIGGAIGGALGSIAYDKASGKPIDWGKAGMAALCGLIPGVGGVAGRVVSRIGFKAITGGFIKSGGKLLANVFAVPLKTALHGVIHTITGGLYGYARTAIPAIMTGTAKDEYYQTALVKNTVSGAIWGGVSGLALGFLSSGYGLLRSVFAAAPATATSTPAAAKTAVAAAPAVAPIAATTTTPATVAPVVVGYSTRALATTTLVGGVIGGAAVKYLPEGFKPSMPEPVQPEPFQLELPPRYEPLGFNEPSTIQNPVTCFVNNYHSSHSANCGSAYPVTIS